MRLLEDALNKQEMGLYMTSHKAGIYEKYIKRILDFIFSLFGLVVLSPLLITLMVVGAIIMKGNPFFFQIRPGKDEKLFKLVKFRTMSNAKDKDENLLPDDKRLNSYGKFLRSTSCDELPELWNILIGTCSFVGPRPLLTSYLSYYDDFQKRRHEVRPGLTGYAQAHGRNSISWENKFEMDVWYVDHISFTTDLRILFDTIKAVLKKEGINSETSATMEEFKGSLRRK